MSDKHLVLVFDDGQHTFRHVDFAKATHEQIFDLAMAVNGFQDAPAVKVLLVETERF